MPWALKRHASQCLVMVLFFLLPMPIPFISGLEHGLLKIDFNTWRIYYFGTILVPGNLFLVCLSIIFLLFVILVLSSLYGKVFCGWMCPQNFFYELFEAVHYTLKKYYPWYRHSPRAQKTLDLAMALFAAVAVTLGVNHYFVGASPIFTGFTSVLFFSFVTIDTHWLKHKFCKHACPYAFIQQSFQDTTSLHVVWENRPGNKCGICQACVKACYVDLDIKKDQFHIDCTQCGACVDACEKVYSRSPEPSLLKFACGTNRGFLGINSLRKGFIVGTFLVFCGFCAWIILNRPTHQFRVDYPMSGGSLSALPFYEEGKPSNHYTLRLRNFSPKSMEVLVETEPGFRIQYLDTTTTIQTLPALEQATLPILIQWDNPDESAPLAFPLKVRLTASGERPEEKEIIFRMPKP